MVLTKVEGEIMNHQASGHVWMSKKNHRKEKSRHLCLVDWLDSMEAVQKSSQHSVGTIP